MHSIVELSIKHHLWLAFVLSLWKQALLQERESSSQLMMDSQYRFQVTFPFCSSPQALELLQVPSSLRLSFATRIWPLTSDLSDLRTRGQLHKMLRHFFFFFKLVITFLSQLRNVDWYHLNLKRLIITSWQTASWSDWLLTVFMCLTPVLMIRMCLCNANICIFLDLFINILITCSLNSVF